MAEFINLSLEMVGSRIDLSVAGPISVDELAASLKRAGIERLIPHPSSGHGADRQILKLTAAKAAEAEPANSHGSPAPGRPSGRRRKSRPDPTSGRPA